MWSQEEAAAKVKGKRGGEDCFLLVSLNQTSYPVTARHLTVSFNCLLKELFDVGIRGKLLSWFRSYLTCRHHRTVIGGCESSLLPISSGVPQGSNLGPLLLIIYMNTAPKAIHSSTTVKLYADDMKCFRIIDNINDVQQLQSDL